MQISEKWLRTLVDPDLSTEELVHLLTMSGLEVEECHALAPAFSGVVVGRVLETGKHPNADRLSLCRIDAGLADPLSIVCGAPNVAVGMKVPVALIGAKLPGETADKPFEIKLAKMRGVESQGMLCSARELGLSQDHSGLMSLPEDAPIGKDFRDYYALDDALITIKLTPNRADCLSVLGVAREVSALTGAPLTPPEIKPVVPVGDAHFPFKISDGKACGRFSGRVITNVNAKAPTPDWMRQRLERAGQRSISALVDVTNYVMLELGRPLHVYNLDKLSGCIDVRFGRKGERLALLNEQTVELDETVLCITDASGPIGLAGIMGGESTKADLETVNIFLESAFFFPDAIAGRTRRFNFTSDAAHRFERGVDFENNVSGLERATRLILDICGGEPAPVHDQIATLPERSAVSMRVARAQKIIGVAIAADEMEQIFSRLGFAFERKHAEGVEGAEVFVVTPPAHRFDIVIEEDLIEEVARVFGFERIPANPPQAAAVMCSQSEVSRSAHDLRRQLAASGYREVINFSFVDAEWESDFAANTAPIRLLNPIASQLAVMRSSLLGSLVANVRYNLNRKRDRVRVFEVGRVFFRDAQAVDGESSVSGLRQPLRLGAIAYGTAFEEQWGVVARKVDYYDLKGDVEALLGALAGEVSFAAVNHPALHPGRSAQILRAGKVIGWIGELHPAWLAKYELPSAPVAFELDVDAISEGPLPVYSELSRFPALIRDLAVVVAENVSAQSLLDAMKSCDLESLRDVQLFDVYQGKGIEPGQKSLAFRVVMQDTSKTLTDEEADFVMARLMEILASRSGAKLRS